MDIFISSGLEAKDEVTMYVYSCEIWEARNWLKGFEVASRVFEDLYKIREAGTESGNKGKKGWSGVLGSLSNMWRRKR